jgi:hypothetical protein
VKYILVNFGHANIDHAFVSEWSKELHSSCSSQLAAWVQIPPNAKIIFFVVFSMFLQIQQFKKHAT